MLRENFRVWKSLGLEYTDLAQFKDQLNGDALSQLSQMNIADAEFRFNKIVYLILKIETSQFCDPRITEQLRKFMKLLDLAVFQEDASQNGKMVQKFILGDFFIQTRILISQLVDLLKDPQKYVQFNKIISEIKSVDANSMLQERVKTDLLLE